MKRAVAAVVLSASLALPAELPVKQVVLYKHGVGFFQREGRLGPGDSARLDFDAWRDSRVLERINFELFEDSGMFEQNVDRLTEALQVDLGWIRKHTEFGEQAHSWAAAGRPRGLLLPSSILEEAEHWIAARPNNAPMPTTEIKAYIAESRRAASRHARGAELPPLKTLDALLRATAEIGARYTNSAAAD